MTIRLAKTAERVAGMAAIVLGLALYLLNLSTMGLVSVDEPRYAAIGQAMARSGDWLTPRLWGQPWFEKPVLLYWITGFGFRLGFGPELAPRLPVAVLSLAFLVFFWFRVRTLWSLPVATYAVAILATSVGWLAYSHIAITDIPLAAAFSAALLLALGEGLCGRRAIAVAALLGVAVLAKSLIPCIFFAPVLLLDRRWKALLRPAPVGAFLLVVLPWHILCALQNGQEFFRVLFLEHQFGRATSTALQHVQPFWYYVPVLAMLLFPWFPLLALAPRPRGNAQIRTLWAVVGFGFVFLSATVNKLPHYPLPLLPALAILLALGLARASRPDRAIIAPLALLGLLPLAAQVAPQALAHGLRQAQASAASALWVVVLGGGAWLVTRAAPFRRFAVPLAMFTAAVAFFWFEVTVFPAVDRAATARPLWVRERPSCAPANKRFLVYGLSYYAGKSVPECHVLDPQHDSVVR